jgi:hypothetical protein
MLKLMPRHLAGQGAVSGSLVSVLVSTSVIVSSTSRPTNSSANAPPSPRQQAGTHRIGLGGHAPELERPSSKIETSMNGLGFSVGTSLNVYTGTDEVGRWSRTTPDERSTK